MPMFFLSCCRYRVAIWVCLAIAEQHKPGPCNSRSNRQCNLLIHPSLVFVLKCLSFYPLRLDDLPFASFLFPWNSSIFAPLSVCILRLCSYCCLALCWFIYQPISTLHGCMLCTLSMWAHSLVPFHKNVVFLESWGVCSELFFYKWTFEYGYGDLY